MKNTQIIFYFDHIHQNCLFLLKRVKIMEIDDQQIELRKDIVASKDTDRKSEEINSIKIVSR